MSTKVNVRLPDDIAAALITYVTDNATSQTEVIVSALRTALFPPTALDPQPRVTLQVSNSRPAHDATCSCRMCRA